MDSKMKSALATGILIVLVGAASVPHSKTCTGDCYSIKALGVSQADGQAKGSFKIVVAQSNGISSDRYAGACLVFSDPDGAGCAQGPDQCQTGTLAELQKNDPGAFAYCAPDKSCWYKVSENHCLKSLYPGQGPYEAGEIKETRSASLSEVRQRLYPRGNAPARIKARTIACLNGKFAVGQERPPCALAPGPGDYIEDFGPPAPLSF
jgi:hypothetical protein